MKRVKRILALVLALCMLCAICAACSEKSSDNDKGSNEKKTETVKNPFIGKWEAHKMTWDDGGSLVFSDYASIAKLELIAEISKDGTYVVHYYVNGVEGDKYPQSGTFTFEDGKLYMDDGAVAEMVGDEMIITYEENLKHHYKPAK